MVVILLFAGSTAFPAEDEEGIPFPNAKINRIDTSNPPEIKIFLTALDGNKKAIKLKDIENLRIMIARGKEGETIAAVFSGKKAVEPYKGSINSFAKSGSPFSFMIVLAGHEDPSLRDGSLGARQKKGIEFFLKELPQENAKGNVIWYGDRLYTYIQKQSGSPDLSNIEKNRAKCAAFLLNKYSNEKDKKNEVECGLFADFKGFGKMIA
ncbi:MAG: hypothetical protein FJ088_11460, partial [Deltaproteobacteria bacterium]|nr:hypothetical protein [Deltaproteobacteria bacterium]